MNDPMDNRAEDVIAEYGLATTALRDEIERLETEVARLTIVRDVAEAFIAHDDAGPFGFEKWSVWTDQWDGLKESLRNVISMSYGDEKELDDGATV